MRQKRAAGTGGGEKTIRDIRRATRRQYSAPAWPSDDRLFNGAWNHDADVR